MKTLTDSSLALILHYSFCVPTPLSAMSVQAVTQDPSNLTSAAVWQSTKAEHIYGLPDIKNNKNGTLTLHTDALTFTAKSGNMSIPRSSITAVSAGNQRVELWGIEGRLLRMAIPNGGGLGAAAFMHHRVDLLTVEFDDRNGGNHTAVFFLPSNEADHALRTFALAPAGRRQISSVGCQNAPVEPRSVLVSAPNWDNAAVPAAYRGLVYEHVVDRLRRKQDIGHVYRDGENDGHGACPQYTVHISIVTFKEGSSVERAVLGPIGEFVGTTQMKFDVTITDASGTLNISKQITATIRGEVESTDVADHLAKIVAKHYVNVLKNAAKGATDAPKS